jgi:hypothetical protein
MYKERHKAVCSKCGYVESSSDTGSFIEAFFLPSMCTHCGEYMDARGSDDRPHWLHVVTKEKYEAIDDKVARFFGLRKWVEVERESWRAR